MFGWFRNLQRQKSTVAPRRPRLSVEGLETRNCPAITLSPTTLAGHAVLLSGQVTGGQAASVTFSGVVSGSAVPNDSGLYSYEATATALGTATATARDGQGAALFSVDATVTNNTPVLTLSVSYLEEKWITLSGTLTDESAGGRTVTFSGAASGSTTTEPDGTFSCTIQAGYLGDVQAATTDPWGASATPASVTLTSDDPMIATFGVSHPSGNVWVFQGTVTDESPEGLVVWFESGTVPEIDGQSATVLENGSFSLAVQVQTSHYGLVSACTTDWWGLDSTLGEDYLSW